MKKILFAVLFLFSLNVVSAQQEDSKDESKSETLEFLEKDGACFMKEFYDLGKVKGVECQVLIITDVVEGSKIGCLRLITRYSSSVTSDTYIGTLDYSEIDACVKSLEYIKSTIQNQPSIYTEIEYKTNDGIEIGAYYNEQSNLAAKKGWRAYVYTKSYTSRSAEYFDASNIDALIGILQNAKNLIAEKLK